jgi:hypothetical protein
LTLSFEFEKEYHFKNPSTKKKREKRKNPGFFPKTLGFSQNPKNPWVLYKTQGFCQPWL